MQSNEEIIGDMDYEEISHDSISLGMPAFDALFPIFSSRHPKGVSGTVEANPSSLREGKALLPG